MNQRQALGIDIDEYARTGGTNFTLARRLVQEGVYDFLIIKAGLGLTKSEVYDEQAQGAEQAGIPYVTYHFLDPVQDIKDQANRYVEWVGEEQPTYIVDVEIPYEVEKGGRLPTKNELKRYLAELERLTGKRPVLYTRMNILDTVGFLAEAEKYHLWLADYPFKDPATGELYRHFDDFLSKFSGTLPPSVRGKNLAKKVILWQFTKKGRGAEYIFNLKTKHPKFEDGKKSADLNVSINERDEFLKLLFGKIPPKPSSVEQILAETLKQLQEMKEAEITPEVQININMAEFNLQELENLQGELEMAGAAPQVHLNVQAVQQGTSFKGSPVKEQPDPVVEPQKSFMVVVKAESGTKTAVQNFKERKNNGVPIMAPHEPRIALTNGTKLRVSATHKESDQDKGDGIIHGDKDRLYYKVTDEASNGEAAGKYVKKVDVEMA